MSDQFMIKWFRENTTEVVEDLGLGDPVIPVYIGHNISEYHDTNFINQPYSPSLLGKYWCQVINTTADPDQPLMRSNVFTLLAPGDYSGPTCISKRLQFQVVQNITCADLHIELTAIPAHSDQTTLSTHESTQCIVTTTG